MDVYWVSENGLERHAAEDLKALRERTGGFTWVDLPESDPESLGLLSEIFGFHPLSLQDCAGRSHIPKIHAYPDHLFAILHAPEAGNPGHVHLLELDLFIGLDFLVTVHGPLGEGVPTEAALRETLAVRDRIEKGRLHPRSPAEVSHAIVAAMIRRMENYVSRLATEVASLERWALEGSVGNTEDALERLFKVRHELLTIQTMAAQGREVHARMESLARFLPGETHAMLRDLVDWYERVRGLCEGEKEFLQGVMDFYQTRTTTKMNIAMERLALIAAVVLPVTAVAGIYGMNIIVPTRTSVGQIVVSLVVMGVVSAGMLVWARRHGWW